MRRWSHWLARRSWFLRRAKVARRLPWCSFLAPSFLVTVINGIIKVVWGSLPRWLAFSCRLCPTFNQLLQCMDVICTLIDTLPHKLISVGGRPRVAPSPANKDLAMVFRVPWHLPVGIEFLELLQRDDLRPPIDSCQGVHVRVWGYVKLVLQKVSASRHRLVFFLPLTVAGTTHPEKVGPLLVLVSYLLLGRKPQEIGSHLSVFIL